MEILRKVTLQYIRILEIVYCNVGIHGQFGTRGQSQSNIVGCLPRQLSVYNNTSNERGCQSQTASAEVFNSLIERSFVVITIIMISMINVPLSERKWKLNRLVILYCHVLKSCLSLHKCCDHCGKQGYHNHCLCPDKVSNRETDAFCVNEFSAAPSIDDADSSNVDNWNSTVLVKGHCILQIPYNHLMLMLMLLRHFWPLEIGCYCRMQFVPY